MSTAPAAPAAIPPPPRGRLRRAVGRSLVVGPLAALLALGALWARSLVGEDFVHCGRCSGVEGPGARSVSIRLIRADVASSRGVVEFAALAAEEPAGPLDDAGLRELRAGFGWQVGWSTEREDRPSLREPEDVGPFRTLRWGREATPALAGPPPAATADRWTLAVPYWLLMAPCVAALAWWAWCPAGRPWPRLTLGRIGLVVLGAGLVLAGLAAIARGGATGRALAVVAEFGGTWRREPNFAGTGRSAVTGVELVGGRALTHADAPRLRAALAAFPHLRLLRLETPGLAGAGLDLLADHPGLLYLSLARSGADDATLAHLARHASLREVDLSGTSVTDAGLAHLARLPELETAWLEGLAITDAGLAALARSPRLAHLFLGGPGAGKRATAAGIRRLFEAIPSLFEVGDLGGKRTYRPWRPGPP